MNSWGVEVPGDAAEQPESQTSKWLMRESISKGQKNMQCKTNLRQLDLNESALDFEA